MPIIKRYVNAGWRFLPRFFSGKNLAARQEKENKGNTPPQGVHDAEGGKNVTASDILRIKSKDEQLRALFEQYKAASTDEELDRIGAAYNSRLDELNAQYGWEPSLVG